MLLFLILSFNTLKLIFSIIPKWNLSSSAINLLSNSNYYNYIVSHREMHSMKVKLEKRITKNEEGISHSNFLSVNEGPEFVVEFENIESFYLNNENNYIICPKGKFHLYDAINKVYKEPNNFEEKGNWDLKCYKHNTGYFLEFYLNNEDKNFFFNSFLVDQDEYRSISFCPQLFDFNLENGEIFFGNNNNYYYRYRLATLISEDEYIKLKNFNAEFHPHDTNDNKIYIYDSFINLKEINLIKAKAFNQATFKNYSNEFYFISYDNISHFFSGYPTNTTSGYNILNNVEFHINEESPFELIDEVEIKEMNFLLYNKYVYYILYSNKTNKTYHGIFDVVLNQIMFNTDEDIDEFIPYSKNAMQAITKQTAYKICAIKDDSGDCIEECQTGKLIIDVDGNKCKESCDNDKYILIPNNICINECDTKFFVYNSTKHCGLCKDMNRLNPYKILGSSECLNDLPEGTEIFNSKLYLLQCKEGYYLENNQCKKVCKNEKCLFCNEQSDNINLCLICKDGYLKINYNNNSFFDCVKNDDPILSRFYYNEILDAFKPCYELCEKCIKEGNEDAHNCLKCIDGYMLMPGINPKNICVKFSEFYYISNDVYHPLDNYICPEEAKFYIREKKSCIDDCLYDDKYNYLFCGNCLKECPQGTMNTNNICRINNNEFYLYENEFSFDFTQDVIMAQLIESYLYEFNYTENFVSLYKNNDNKLILFKNSSSIEKLNISNPVYRKCRAKIMKYFNIKDDMILKEILKNERTGKYEFMFFNISSKEYLDIGNLCENIDKRENLDLNNKSFINFSEIISNFNGDSLLINEKNKFYELSYLSKQIQNLSIINLGYCEKILKTENGIDLKEELIIFKIEYLIHEFSIPIIDYKIFDKKGKQLNLDCCSNVSIEFQIPVEINENEIYKYDPNSFYYNDKCYPVKTNNGTDLTIFDRKNEYNNNYMSLCQTDCNFKRYDKETNKAICDCSSRSKLPFDDIFNVDKDMLLKKFINVKNLLNIDVIKCYKLIFVDNGLLKNIGSYIISSIFLINTIASIVLYLKDFNIIKNKIKNIIQNKLNTSINNSKEKINQNEQIDKNLNPPKKGKEKVKNSNQNFF